jgi:hypothetical protein
MSLPPAQPAYIFRGHAAQIHWTSFIRSNTRLLSGDADGWIVIWVLAIKRPVVVWRAHEGAILGASSWGADKIITWVGPFFIWAVLSPSRCLECFLDCYWVFPRGMCWLPAFLLYFLANFFFQRFWTLLATAHSSSLFRASALHWHGDIVMEKTTSSLYGSFPKRMNLQWAQSFQ